MWYEITLKFRTKAANRQQAEAVRDEAFSGIMAEVDDLEVVGSDVQELPRTYVPFPEEEAAQVSFVAPSGVMHPWDQGSWIFPEDHPLRYYEEKAKEGDEEAQKVLDRSVEAVKQLNP